MPLSPFLTFARGFALTLTCLCAVSGCASTPSPTLVAETAPAPPVVPEPVPVMEEILLDAPDAGLDFSALRAQYLGGPADAATRAQLAADLHEAYAWAEWQDIHVTVDAVTSAAGHWEARVRALPPPALPPLPVALRFPVLKPAASIKSAVGGRVELSLDARFDSWMRSSGAILIDASEHRLYFKRANGQVVSYPVALGTPRTPTPFRDFRIEAVVSNPTWFPPPSIRREYKVKGKVLPESVPPGPGNPLGSYFVKLQNGIGIHGTNQPRSIGRPASHGCIRMHDRDVRELAPQLKAGDAVSVVQALPSLTASKDTP